MWSRKIKLDYLKYNWNQVCWSSLFFFFVVSPPRLHGIWHDISQLQHPAVAHHPLPRERFSLRLLAESCSGDVGRLGDGRVGSVRSGSPAHRDLWHGGKTSHRAPGPKEQKHPGYKGVALLHRRPGSVSFTGIFGPSLSLYQYVWLSTNQSSCCLF